MICWDCGSQERHRAVWLVLDRLRPELLESARTLLHFAPDPVLERHSRDRPCLRYVSGDLDPDVGELTLDITAIDLADASFDAILCARARPRGSPGDARAPARARTRRLGACDGAPEPRARAHPRGPVRTDPAECKRLYWQEDHVRLYGLDIADRLRDSGFDVEVIRVLGPRAGV